MFIQSLSGLVFCLSPTFEVEIYVRPWMVEDSRNSLTTSMIPANVICKTEKEDKLCINIYQCRVYMHCTERQTYGSGRFAGEQVCSACLLRKQSSSLYYLLHFSMGNITLAFHSLQDLKMHTFLEEIIQLPLIIVVQILKYYEMFPNLHRIQLVLIFS